MGFIKTKMLKSSCPVTLQRGRGLTRLLDTIGVPAFQTPAPALPGKEVLAHFPAEGYNTFDL